MFLYVLKTGFKNLGARKLFTFASIGTIACSVFIYCLFFIVASNIEDTINRVETTVGIQVFFDEGISEEEIQRIADTEFNTDAVKSMHFKSSSEAWETFKKDYFDDKEELAAAFEDDNPLMNSASYEILLNDITKQYDYVNYISKIPGVRQVNYSNVLIDTLTSINSGFSIFSLVLITLFVIIAIILISNTITLASQFRKKENEIMKLIGATNFMIRAPFVIEGFFIGFFGAMIPLIIVCAAYQYYIKFLSVKMSFLSNVFVPTSLKVMIIPMAGMAIVCSCILAMFVSFITIRKHLKV